MRRVILAALATLSLGSLTQAWNGHGHMLISWIAWQQLDDAVREDLVNLLRKHPRFEEDFVARMPPDLDEEREDLWIFLHASRWPDIARGLKGQARKDHHHSSWHYVNFPHVLDTADLAWFEDAAPVNLRTEWSPDLWSSRMNVLQALHQSMDRLQAPTVSSADKAVSLCWLLHLVGDLHQPMHSTAFFTRGRFPEGDRGGNSIPVSPDDNLHSFWDRVLGRSEELDTLEERVIVLQEDAELTAHGTTAAEVLDFLEWARESQALARSTAYSDRLLQVIKTGEDDPQAHLPRTTLDHDYQSRARREARRRVVEAGHRIAALAATLDL